MDNEYQCVTFDDLLSEHSTDEIIAALMHLIKQRFTYDKLDEIEDDPYSYISYDLELLLEDAPEITNELLNYFNIQYDSIDSSFNARLCELNIQKELDNYFDTYIKAKATDSAHILSDMNDSPGDTFYKPDNMPMLDIVSRDTAFVYLDGTIIMGKPGETHSDIVSRELHHNYGPGRPYAHALPAEAVAFGHIINDIGFVEVTEGCSKEEVASQLVSQYNIVKVYSEPDSSDKITRLARRVE